MSHRSIALAAVALFSASLTACGAAKSDAVDVSPRSDQGMARPDPAQLERPSLTGTAPGALPPAGGWSLFSVENPIMGPRPTGALAIGSRCEAAQSEAKGFGDVCGTKGRVAVEFDGSSTIMTPNPPCALVTFIWKKKPNAEKPPAMMTDSLSKSACVAGQDLLASGACQMCRIPNVGWSFHGRVDEMTKAQGSALLAKLDVTGDPPATAKGWAELIDQSKAKVAAN